MSLTASRLTTKTTVMAKPRPPYDVNDPPDTWVTVLDNYYVEWKNQTSDAQPSMGGVATVPVVAVLGRYTDQITPGMRLRTHFGAYEIIDAVPDDGMCQLSMRARRVM